MSTPSVDVALQVKKWESEATKKFAIASIWAQFSSNMISGLAYGNTQSMVPTNVIAVKQFTPESGQYSTTIPWVGKMTKRTIGGSQKAEGEEGSVGLRYKQCFYQVERQQIALQDETVEGGFAAFYKLGGMQVDQITNSFVESTDFKINEAVLEGADHFLTDSQYWTGSVSVPCTKAYHPKIYTRNTSTGADRLKVTWNSNNTTYETAIQTRFNAMTHTANPFDKDAVESICSLAHRKLSPLTEGALAEKGIKYVACISDMQFTELIAGASNSFLQPFRDAAERSNDNIGLTGKIGLYRDVLFMVNGRNPIWDTAGSAAAYLSYVTEATDDASGTGSAFLARTAKATSGSGTIELAMVFGKGGLLKAQAGDAIKFVNKKFDYEFWDGMCGMRKEGYQRSDFGNSGSLEPVNESSLIYATASATTES